MRRALCVIAASTVVVGAVAAPAQLVPSASAAGGEHGAEHEPASGSGSEKKSGGGGVGSTVNKVTCGAQNIVNRVTLGFFGSPCSSSSGSVDPVQATSSILQQTFGGLAVAASPLLAGTLTQVPDYSSQSGGVVGLERSTTAIGFAVAGLVLTLSILRFALAGVSASGGFEGAEGVTRTVAAALAMLAWPWAFHNLAALMNTVTHALLSTHSVHVALLGLVAVGGVGAVLLATHSKIGWVFGIVILGLEALLMIGLLLMKVLLAGATTLIFVAMPLALALWPLRETSWIAGRLAHVLFVAVATPLLWALIFATAAVMGGSVFGLQGGFWDTILIRPLAAMSMFVLALLAPLMLLRHAHGGIGHPVGRLAGYASMRLATNAVGAHLPEQFGGRRPRAAAPAPELQLTQDLATGAVSGRPSLSVPINRDTSDAVQAFLDGVSNPDASGAAATAFPATGDDGVGRTDEERGDVAPTGAASAVSAGARPREDAERFSFRDPARPLVRGFTGIRAGEGARRPERAKRLRRTSRAGLVLAAHAGTNPGPVPARSAGERSRGSPRRIGVPRQDGGQRAERGDLRPPGRRALGACRGGRRGSHRAVRRIARSRTSGRQLATWGRPSGGIGRRGSGTARRAASDPLPRTPGDIRG